MIRFLKHSQIIFDGKNPPLDNYRNIFASLSDTDTNTDIFYRQKSIGIRIDTNSFFGEEIFSIDLISDLWEENESLRKTVACLNVLQS